MSNIFSILGNQISSFGTVEWCLIALVAILLITLFIYNKGVLKCKGIIEQLETENKAYKDYILSKENENIIDERGDN